MDLSPESGNRAREAAPSRVPPDEARLAARWREGDVEAFGDLALRYAPRVRGYLASWTRDEAEREDLCQEAMLRVFAQGRRIPEGTPLDLLLLRTARNLAVDLHRRRAVRRAAPPGPAPAAPAAPGDAVQAEEARRRTAEAFERLPLEEREALALKVRGGLPWRQVAEVLGCSEDAAARRGAAGLARLARELGEAP